MFEFRKNASIDLGKRRGELDIIADILSCTSQPVNKTKIMYKANLSFAQLNHYLEKMKNSELIEKRNTPITYLITEKGKNFLELYLQMMEILYSEK